MTEKPYILPMKNVPDSATGEHRTTRLVHQRIERGGERVWRLKDFEDLPFEAVAQALSRLTRKGELERLSKGVYYCSRQTAFGKSRPIPPRSKSSQQRLKTLFPSGIAAANLLGFTTQIGRRPEVATSSPSVPRKLLGNETVIHTRRPQDWAGLSQTDAALLDFLRGGGSASELTPEETVRKTLALMSEKGRFDRLLQVADSEPPRVRAILGALGQQLGQDEKSLRRLRASLNPFSRFNFGVLAGLRYASEWQAKERTQQMKLFEHPDFQQAILRAAEHFRGRGLRQAIIEKDYYVTEALTDHRRYRRQASDLQGRHESVQGMESDPAILRRYRHLP